MMKVNETHIFELTRHNDELNDILWFIKIAVDKSSAIQDGYAEDEKFIPSIADVDLIHSAFSMTWRRVSEVSQTLNELVEQVSDAKRAA